MPLSPDWFESIREEAGAENMTAPTEEQLRDPAWWDENAPDDAEIVWLVWNGAPRIASLSRIAWAKRGEGIVCGQDQVTEYHHRPTKPEPQAWDGETWPIPIGSQCECTFAVEHHDTWHKGEVTFEGVDPEGREFFIVDTGVYQACYRSTDHVRPIRTKEQRDTEDLARALLDDLDVLGVNVGGKIATALAIGIKNRGWRKDSA